MPAPLKRLHGAARAALLLLSFSACLAHADWSNFGTVSMTDATHPKLTNRYGCYTDGKDIVCDSATSAVNFGSGGLITTGGMTVMGSISASGVSATYVSATVLQINPSTMPCSTGLNGTIRYSSVSNTLEVCAGTSWSTLSSNTAPGNLSGTGSATAVAFWTGTNSLSYDSNLYWNNTAKRLGVGTTLPSSTLYVAGGAGASGGIVLGETGGADRFSIYQYGSLSAMMQVNKFGGLFIADNAATPFAAFHSNGKGLTVGSNFVNTSTPSGLLVEGKVGVGTTSPTATVQVSGTLTVSASGQTTTPTLYVTSGGKVGIGTGAPTDQLMVDTGASAGGIRVTNDGTGWPYVMLTDLGTVNWFMNVSGTDPKFRVTSSGGAVGAGTDRMVIDTAGNVGIGTSTPVYGLDVSTTVGQRITSLYPLLVFNELDTGVSWTLVQDGGSIGFRYQSLATTPILNMTSSGVGIGTYGYGNSSLTIANGEVQPSSSGAACTTATNGGAIRYSAGTLYYCNGANTWTALSTGGGTLTGGGSATAVAFWNGPSSLTYDSTTTGGLYWNGAKQVLGLGSNAPVVTEGYGINVVNSANTGTADSNAVMILQSVNRNAHYYTSIPVTGYSSFLAQTVSYDILGGMQVVGNNGSPYTRFYSSGTEAFRVDSKGQVGIGLISPTATLQVSGTFMVSNSAQTTPSLYVGANGNVGIGTNTPAMPLHIKGRYAGILLNETYAGADNEAFLVNYNNVFAIQNRRDDGTFLSVPYSFDMRAPADTLFATASGSVGIGYGSVGSSLTVVGEAQVGNSGAACVSGYNSGAIRYSAGTLYYCNGANTWTALGTGGGTLTGSGSATAVAFWNGPNSLTYESSTTSGLYWDAANKRLGVGTTTPTYAISTYSGTDTGLGQFKTSNTSVGYIDIQNNGAGPGVGVDMRLITRNAANANTTAVDLVKYQTGGFNINNNETDAAAFTAFGLGGVERVRIASSGNVGIGTAAPTATLQVSGTFTVSNSLQFPTAPSLYIAGNGNVGMGTNVPFAALDVSGDIRASDGGGTTEKAVFLRYVPNIGAGVVGTFDWGSATYKNTLIWAGSLGIGGAGAAPGSSLTVVGEVQPGSSGAACVTATNGGAIRYSAGTLYYCNGSNTWSALSTGGGTLTGAGSATAVAFWNGPNSLTYESSTTSGLYWDHANSRMGIGTNTPSTLMEIVNANGSAYVQTVAYRTNTFGGGFEARHARGTQSSPSALQDGDVAGGLFFKGFDGGSFLNTAVIQSVVEGTPVSGSSMSGGLAFLTAQPGTPGLSKERLRISGDGNVGIGTVTPTATLQVSGTFTVSTTATMDSPSLFVGTNGGVSIGSTTNAWVNSGTSVYIARQSNRWGMVIAGDKSNQSDLLFLTGHNAADQHAVQFVNSLNAFDIRLVTDAGAAGRSFFHSNLTTGSVGISNTNPIAKLDVWGSISASDAIQVGQSNYTCINQISGSIRFNTTSNTLQVCTNVGWVSLASGTTGGGGGTLTGGGSATAVAFWNGANSLTYDSANTGGFYYDNTNKRLGIGTNAPANALTVSTTTSPMALFVTNGDGINPVIQLKDNSPGQGRAGAINFLDASGLSKGQIAYATGYNYMRLTTSATERVRIIGSGEVGIGTSSPTATLQISGTFTVSNSTQTANPSLFVSNSGNVGLGSMNPATRLDLGSASADNKPLLSLRAGTATGIDYTGFFHNDLLLGSYLTSSSYPVHYISFGHTGDPQRRFEIGSANNSTFASASFVPHFTVMSDGRVGIGTPNPTSSLTIVGEAQVGNSGAACVTATNGGAIRYNAGTLSYCNGSNTWATIGGGGGTLTGAGSATAVAFWNGPNSLNYDSRLYWDNVGKNLGIGTETPSFPLTVSSSTSTSIVGYVSASDHYGMYGVATSAASYGAAGQNTVSGYYAVLGGRNFGMLSSGPVSINAGASPTATLQVSGTFVVSTTGQTNAGSASLAVDSRGISVSTILHMGSSAFTPIGAGGNAILSGTTAVSTSSAGSITFYAGGAERGHIDSINTTLLGPMILSTTAMPMMKMYGGSGMQRISFKILSGTGYVYAYDDVSATGAPLVLGGTGSPGMGINIDPSGNVGIGTSTQNYRLKVQDSQTNNPVALIVNTANTTTAHGLGILAGTNSSSGAYMVAFYRNDSTFIGGIQQSGASSIAYNTTSDRRTKENITDTREGLQKLMQLPVRDFSFRADTSHTTVTGFIAQELDKVFPEAVTTNGDNGETPLKDNAKPWSVDYGRVTPLIVKAVQDLNGKTDAQVVSLTTQLKDANDNIVSLTTQMKAANDNIQTLGTALDALRQEVRQLKQQAK